MSALIVISISEENKKTLNVYITIHMIIHVRFFTFQLKVSCRHLVSSDITEIMLKVVLNTIISTPCEFRSANLVEVHPCYICIKPFSGTIEELIINMFPLRYYCNLTMACCSDLL